MSTSGHIVEFMVQYQKTEKSAQRTLLLFVSLPPLLSSLTHYEDQNLPMAVSLCSPNTPEVGSFLESLSQEKLTFFLAKQKTNFGTNNCSTRQPLISGYFGCLSVVHYDGDLFNTPYPSALAPHSLTFQCLLVGESVYFRGGGALDFRLLSTKIAHPFWAPRRTRVIRLEQAHFILTHIILIYISSITRELGRVYSLSIIDKVLGKWPHIFTYTDSSTPYSHLSISSPPRLSKKSCHISNKHWVQTVLSYWASRPGHACSKIFMVVRLNLFCSI